MDLEGQGDGKELGGVEEGKTLIRIRYVRKESLFNKRGKLPLIRSTFSACSILQFMVIF